MVGFSENIKYANLNYFVSICSNAFKYYENFYTPWKRQKTKGFFTFLGGIEVCRIPKNNEINENIDRKSAKKESEALSCMVIFF